MEKVPRRLYYDKGGHLERSKFWDEVTQIAKGLRRSYPPVQGFVFVHDQAQDQAYILRRQMRRDPRDGRV